MNRETAEKIIEATRRIDSILGELDLVSLEIEDEAERMKIRRGIAGCIHHVYIGLTREVALEYPDLHPDFPDGGWPGDPRKAGKP